MKRQWDQDELAEQWTLAPEELARLANKAGPTRLGFALLLKVFVRDGRFPAVAAGGRWRSSRASRQTGGRAGRAVPAGRLAWPRHQYHRAQIRAFFGFREATVHGEAPWRGC